MSETALETLTEQLGIVPTELENLLQSAASAFDRSHGLQTRFDSTSTSLRESLNGLRDSSEHLNQEASQNFELLVGVISELEQRINSMRDHINSADTESRAAVTTLGESLSAYKSFVDSSTQMAHDSAVQIHADTATWGTAAASMQSRLQTELNSLTDQVHALEREASRALQSLDTVSSELGSTIQNAQHVLDPAANHLESVLHTLQTQLEDQLTQTCNTAIIVRARHDVDTLVPRLEQEVFNPNHLAATDLVDKLNSFIKAVTQRLEELATSRQRLHEDLQGLTDLTLHKLGPQIADAKQHCQDVDHDLV